MPARTSAPPAATCFSAHSTRSALLAFASATFLLAASSPLLGQASPRAQSASGPIAYVSLDSKIPGSAAVVTGALEVSNGKVVIAGGGTVTAGSDTAVVLMPHRGVLRICASTAVKLASDGAPDGEIPGLMMAIDHGAVEASFANGSKGDYLLTPDFRVLIGGPGAAEVKVRLSPQGDTCVENASADNSNVVVSSVYEGSAYRLQPRQRVLFQHGSLKDVIDNERESCGCPPSPTAVKGNEFPLAQSEGLAPLPPPQPVPSTVARATAPAPVVPPLVYNGAPVAPKPAAAPVAPAPKPVPVQPQAAPVVPQTVNAAPAPKEKKKKESKGNGFAKFFRKIHMWSDEY